jgi:hypothetical protein
MSKPIAQRTHKKSREAFQGRGPRVTTHPRKTDRQIGAMERAERTPAEQVAVFAHRLGRGYSMHLGEHERASAARLAAA